MIQTNIIDCAYRYGAKKLIFLGSSCIYPKFANQPIKEEELMTGALEPSNDAYATAKIAGIKMCQAYRQQYGFDAISVMPTNLDDLAEALYLLMNQYSDASPINVGTGEDVTIKELAETVGRVVGSKEIEWDTSKPNGTPRKVLDVSKIKSMGWKPTISLRDGIESTYQDYIK